MLHWELQVYPTAIGKIKTAYTLKVEAPPASDLRVCQPGSHREREVERVFSSEAQEERPRGIELRWKLTKQPSLMILK